MSDPQVLTTPLGGGALTRDALAGATGGSWYDPRPRYVEEWRLRCEKVGRHVAPGWMASLSDALPAEGPGIERLARTAAAGGVVVTTGQQPGLFGGPVYTWAKAFSALELADELERAAGFPVAPVFWAATDDADFAESATTWILAGGELRSLALADAPGAGERSLSEVKLPDTSAQLAELSRAAGSAAWREAIDAARASYAPGATIGGAYLGLLRRLLGPLGIAVLDASHPSVRRAADSLLRSALERAGDIERALIERGDGLVRAGYEPQVAQVRGLSLVFESRDADRRRVPIASSGERSKAAPHGSLGPNVLLRPIVERALLPTVAYVAGPAEIAYFAQSSAVADALEAPRPLAVSRWSGMVVEPHVARALERTGLDIADVRDRGAAESKVADRIMSSHLHDGIERYRDAISAAQAELRRSIMLERSAKVEPSVVDGLERDVVRRTDRLARRIRAAVKRAERDAMADVGLAHSALFPHGKRQERVLNFLPMLARYGPALMSAVRERAAEHARALVGGTYAAAQVEPPEHRSSVVP